MESSERLDDLVARARALFERKHGEAEGCFAAFSPAKVVSEEGQETALLLLCKPPSAYTRANRPAT